MDSVMRRAKRIHDAKVSLNQDTSPRKLKAMVYLMQTFIEDGEIEDADVALVLVSHITPYAQSITNENALTLVNDFIAYHGIFDTLSQAEDLGDGNAVSLKASANTIKAFIYNKLQDVSSLTGAALVEALV